jgi:hypothetical protein
MQSTRESARRTSQELLECSSYSTESNPVAKRNQFLATVMRGKPREVRIKLNRPFRGAYFVLKHTASCEPAISPKRILGETSSKTYFTLTAFA